MEKWFKKEKFRCMICDGNLKFGNFYIDNVDMEPISMSCKKCGYTLLDPVSTKIAIAEVKIAYKGNNKIIKEITNYLKKNML